MSDYDDHSLFDPELDAMRKETTAYKFGELSDAVHGCAMVVADRLFVLLPRWIVYRMLPAYGSMASAITVWVADIMARFYEKVLRGGKQDG